MLYGNKLYPSVKLEKKLFFMSLIVFFRGECFVCEQIWCVLKMENRPEGANGNRATPKREQQHSPSTTKL